MDTTLNQYNNSKDTAVLLISHGSTKPYNEEVFTEICEKFKKSTGFDTEVGYMKVTDPTIPQAIKNLKDRNKNLENIIAVPVFLAPGIHTKIDIPILLGLEPLEEDPRCPDGNYPEGHYLNGIEEVDFNGNIKLVNPIGPNKKLLDIMSENYEIRTSYRAHIQDLLKSEEGVLKASYLKDISNYLENLFGYKDKASLVDYIGSRYSCKEIVVGDSIVEIRATTNNTRHHGIPDKMVLKEIRNYSRNVNRIDKVIIVIDNIADTPIQRIEHSVNINNSSCSTQFIYKNGRELPPDIIKPFYF